MEEFTKFLFELGQLKKIKNSGFRLVGVDNPSSVAGHSLRAAQIGYILAKLENHENPFEVCTMLVFHDIGECRVGDINRVENRYIDVKEKEAVEEQLKPLGEIGKEILNLWNKVESRDTPAGIIARDADLLEHSLTAKEFVEKGVSYAQNWIDNSESEIKTESAKKLMNSLINSNSNDWWQGLKKLKY